MPLVKVIIGSTRPGRFGVQPATWIMNLAKEHPEINFELVDLKEINLPFLDEEKPALLGEYKNAHTKAWSQIVGEADGFIVVTGEYNHTVTPALINAIDFLAAEWRYKPVAFVSYGASAGGARAVEHLRSVVGRLGMYDLTDGVHIVNYWTQLDESGTFQPTEEQTTTAHGLIKNVGFWAENLKTARQKLAEKA
ncbi:MAG TPA: NAD(P)H-dependent oxidoreductase [Candidatus Saccharimonadales bacterium]|nr:NAD(P)H-dependent oxidoreductase [Candidatus Saccharimonadales bacterium]